MNLYLEKKRTLKLVIFLSYLDGVVAEQAQIHRATN